MRYGGLVTAMALVGALAWGTSCSGDGSAGSPESAGTPTVSTSATSATSSATSLPATGCPVTHPTMFDPPPGVEPSALFGAAVSHGNGQLWVGGLGEGGVLVLPRDADGVISNKFGWWRATQGQLQITGRRLDGPAPDLEAHVPSGYGTIGFQSSAVSFPTEGCWQITGRVGQTTLTFVTRVLAE